MEIDELLSNIVLKESPSQIGRNGVNCLPCSDQHRIVILVQNLEVIGLIAEKYWPFLICSEHQ